MSAIASIAVDSRVCEIADMSAAQLNPSLYETLLALKPAGLSMNGWAMKAGVNRTIFNDVKKRGNIRHDSLIKLLSAAGVSLADFEAGQARVQSEVRGTGMSPREVRDAWVLAGNGVTPVPLVGSAFGGEWNDLEDVEMIELRLSEVLDYIARPPSLAEDPDAYAVEIVGESMVPRYEPGERVFVSPKAAVRIGDDVIVQLRGTGEDQLADHVTEVLIKRLVRRTAGGYELRQFNPEKTFTVPAARVAAIHRVRGRL